MRIFLGVTDPRLGAFLDAGDVVTQVTQAVAVLQMLATVVTFLADKATDLLFQRGVIDLVTEVPHRIDKEAFAIGEQHRHGVEQVAFKGIAAVPMTRQRVGKIEIHMPWTNLQTVRGGADHADSLSP